MTLPPPDWLHRALAGAATFLFLAWLVTWLRSRGRGLRLAALEKELFSLKSAPEKAEVRVDRFDLLWYPTVTYSSAQRRVIGVAPGLPHCRSCHVPLSSANGGWSCPKCGGKHAESLADLMVADSVTGEALRYFLERHPDYQAPQSR